MRERININSDWLFALNGVAYRADLPHTWNSADGQDGTDGYVRATASYSKTLFPVANGRVFLDIEGANSAAQVYANGNLILSHKGGYSAFRTELTPYIRDDCLIEIKVDNRDISDVYPSNADFTFYGGLYRNVSLVKTGNCRFSYRESASDGVYVTPVKHFDGWEILVRTLIDYPDDSFDVAYTLTDADGKSVFATKVKPSKPDIRFKVDNPHLWQGREDPYLYTLHCSIEKDDECSDNLDIDVGFREIRVDPEQGFFLNGKHIKLKGVSRHQDRANMGNAITENEHAEDVKLIYELGANSVRLAHYQQNRYFYSLCDRAGLLVWAEIPVISRFSLKKQVNARQQLCELIRQNYNHACIYCWGIENEITIAGSAKSKVLHKCMLELNEIVHMLDRTRLSTCAQVMMCAPEEKLNNITDILGYNHYFGWYAGRAEDIGGWLDGFHKKQPGVCLCLSEYGAEGITQYHSASPVQGDYSEDYQALFHEKYIEAINCREWLFGSYVWNMFDFGSAARNEGGVRGRNNKGLVTFDRKTRKDSFYLYKSYWSDEKFVHITGERYVERLVGQAKVKVYSNCERVKLTVNGSEQELFGNNIFIFNVTFSMGENIIKAQCGDCTHEITINGVSKPNPQYSMPEGASSFVRNWFEPEGADVNGRLSIDDTVGDVLKSEEAMKLIGSVAGNVANSPLLKLASPVKIRTLLKLAKPVMGQDMTSMAQGYLQTIPKK